ncbi:MAG: hypothetical protein H6718_08335 [Polyangiaceae bacterium]|nr:hypothetical protein [Polyangiaceae bacterium]MCB9606593.1 hypothetical protein [Polyangiaceae bacterium]
MTTLLRWDRLLCLSLATFVCVACGLNPQPEPPVEDLTSDGGRGGSGRSAGGSGGSGVSSGGAENGGSGAVGSGGSSFDFDGGAPAPEAGDADPNAFMDGGEGGETPDSGDAGDAPDAAEDADSDSAADGELAL